MDLLTGKDGTMTDTTLWNGQPTTDCKWCGRGERDGVKVERGVVCGAVCEDCRETEKEAQG